jgi:hypothetical protein
MILPPEVGLGIGKALLDMTLRYGIFEFFLLRFISIKEWGLKALRELEFINSLSADSVV